MPRVKPRITSHQFRQALRRACAAAGGQKAWATLHHISDTYVSDVLRGRREPGPSTYAALGMQRVVLYEASDPALAGSIA